MTTSDNMTKAGTCPPEGRGGILGHLQICSLGIYEERRVQATGVRMPLNTTVYYTNLFNAKATACFGGTFDVGWNR